MKRIIVICVVFTILSLVMVGCTSEPEQKTPGGYITGATLNETTSGSRDHFHVEISDSTPTIGLDIRGTILTGSMSVQVKKVNGDIVYQKDLTGPAMQITEKIPLSPGTYTISISWPTAIQANYNIEWSPGQIDIPRITALGFIPGFGMLVAGLIFTIYGIRRGGWKFALIGAAFWAGTVIIKFIIAALINGKLYQLVTQSIPGLPGILLFSVYIGLLTGLTEILITWIFLRFTRLGQTVWNKMLSFSLGFGGIEAILLGLSSLVGVISAMTMGSLIPLPALRQIALTNNLLYDLAPIVERIFTIGVHLGCNLLLFYAVLKKEIRWFWASFALKSGIDAVAGYAQLSGQLTSIGFLWVIEVAVVVFGLIGFGVSRWLKPRILTNELPVQSPELDQAL